jgi:hypothetical protein
MSAANGCGHRGRGDGWRLTQSSCACGSSTQRGRCLVLQHQPTKTSSCLCFCSVHFRGGGANTPMLQSKRTQVREVENVVMLTSIWEDAKGLIRKVALLEGEFAEARQAQKVVEEKFCSLPNASVDSARWLSGF